MSGSGIFKRRVWAGTLAVVVGIAAWAWWLHLQRSQPVPPARGRQPFVQLATASSAQGNTILQERAELLDPTPLFFPTEWNYGQRPLNERRLRQPGQFYVSFEPKLTVPEQGLSPYGLEAVQAPERLADVVAQGNEAPFAGLGQIDLRTSTLPVRAGFLEVRKLGHGEFIINQMLTGIVPPRLDFAPLEFLVVVGPAGLIGDPILTRGSGWDEVDSFFRAYLAKSYHLGERLPPGSYRVVVGA